MTPEQALFLSNFLLEGIEKETQSTRKVIATIPEAKRNYRPEPHSRTALELAWHLAEGDVWFLEGIANAKFGPGGDMPGEIKSIADVLSWYDKKYPAALARVRVLPAERLAQPVDFFGMLNLPVVSYLMILNNHAMHHRGQLTTYLRPMGSKVPNIMGGSFDQPM